MVEKTLYQIRLALAILMVIIFIGTFGYMIIEGWNFLDSLYMTIISITTTGFAEVHPLSETGRLFTIGVIIAGVTTLAYTGGRAAQFLIETQILRRRQMSKQLKSLENHYIICGFGRMGKQICEELEEARAPFVVIEKNDEEIDSIIERGYLYVKGDATQDETLLAAGIKRARGLVATLATDAENVFTTLSAKVLNPHIFVVARAIEDETESKLRKAGADRVVKPYEIGGSRMAQVLLRPGVVDFIDIVARGKGMDLKLEEIRVGPNSTLIGKTLAESPLRKDLNIIVVAIFRSNNDFIYNPGSNTRILEGDRLIAIGTEKSLNELNRLCRIEETVR